jgi:Domain of unknown function (DUF4926)
MDHADRRCDSSLCHVLGFVMTNLKNDGDERATLTAVALLRDIRERGLVRGQVGTIVEALDEATALVEFSDNEGRAYALVPVSRGDLLALRTAPLAA